MSLSQGYHVDETGSHREERALMDNPVMKRSLTYLLTQCQGIVTLLGTLQELIGTLLQSVLRAKNHMKQVKIEAGWRTGSEGHDNVERSARVAETRRSRLSSERREGVPDDKSLTHHRVGMYEGFSKRRNWWDLTFGCVDGTRMRKVSIDFPTWWRLHREARGSHEWSPWPACHTLDNCAE